MLIMRSFRIDDELYRRFKCIIPQKKKRTVQSFFTKAVLDLVEREEKNKKG